MMEEMNSINIAKARSLHRKNVREAALIIAETVESNKELSSLRIGEIKDALDLAKVYIETVYSQVSLEQAFAITNSLPSNEISLRRELMTRM